MQENDSPRQELTKELSELRQKVQRLERKAADSDTTIRALETGTERLLGIIGNLSSAVVEADASGRFTYCSPQVADIFGILPEDAVGTDGFGYVHPDDLQTCIDALGKALGEQGIFSYEYRAKHADGHWLNISASGRIVGVGADTRIFGVLTDITDRKHIEEELLKARKLESIGLLAGGIAHDFNNILTSILGNINLARMSAEADSRIAKFLADGERATLKARRLTSQLLTFAHGGAPILAVTPLKQVFETATELLTPQRDPPPPRAFPKGLWMVEVDQEQIGLALAYLLRYLALRAEDDTPVGVSAKNCGPKRPLPTLNDRRYLRLTLEQGGPGLTQEEVDRIFEPYACPPSQGTGLELATSFKILQRHGGTITAASSPETGIRFEIYLPAIRSITEEYQRRTTPIDAAGRRVLVMDDEAAVRTVARRMLERIGFAVTVAEHGQEAIALYEQALTTDRPFDAVIMDLVIDGGMGGKETMRRLLELDPNVSAIVASGYSNDDVMARYRQYGFRAVLAKPFQMSELTAALGQALEE
ncbi:MAG: response regulator [bacterium]